MRAMPEPVTSEARVVSGSMGKTHIAHERMPAWGKRVPGKAKRKSPPTCRASETADMGNRRTGHGAGPRACGVDRRALGAQPAVPCGRCAGRALATCSGSRRTESTPVRTAPRAKDQVTPDPRRMSLLGGHRESQARSRPPARAQGLHPQVSRQTKLWKARQRSQYYRIHQCLSTLSIKCV